jgi:hypothetical protein
MHENDKALRAFLAAKAEIDTLLERLKDLSEDHFEVSPEQSHWGHVGTLDYYRETLRQITDKAFREGDYAP